MHPDAGRPCCGPERRSDPSAGQVRAAARRFCCSPHGSLHPSLKKHHQHILFRRGCRRCVLADRQWAAWWCGGARRVLPRLHTAGVHELVGSGGTETPAKDSMEALLLKWGLHGHLPRDALTTEGDAKKNLSLLQVVAAWERALDAPGGFDAGDHRQATMAALSDGDMAALSDGESGAAVDGTAMPFSPVRPVVWLDLFRSPTPEEQQHWLVERVQVAND